MGCPCTAHGQGSKEKSCRATGGAGSSRKVDAHPTADAVRGFEQHHAHACGRMSRSMVSRMIRGRVCHCCAQQLACFVQGGGGVQARHACPNHHHIGGILQLRGAWACGSRPARREASRTGREGPANQLATM